MIALDHGEPKEFTLVQLLERFRDHRVEVIQRRSQHELEKAQAEKHIAEGLVAALGTIDEVIEIIRGAADRSEASEKLQDLLGLSEIQADAILNMRLAKLTSLEQAELKRRLKELRALIRGLKEILKSEARKLEIMLEELDEIVEKYGDARRERLSGADFRSAHAELVARLHREWASPFPPGVGCTRGGKGVQGSVDLRADSG